MGVFRKNKDKNGKPTGPWYVQYPASRDAKGKIKYKTLKASWQKKKAQEMLRKKQDEFYQAERLGITATKEMSFSELMDWGLSQEIMKAKATASDDVKRAEHLKAAFGEIMANQVTPLMVDNFRVKMKNTVSKHTGRPFSGTTINKLVSLGRRTYYLAMDQGLVASNPFARRGMYKELPKGQYIADEEFRAILRYLPGYMKPVVLTAYLTGMRRGEILGLKWSQVDLKQGTLDLSAEDTKTEEPRVIYLGSLPELRRVFVKAMLRKRSRQKLVFTKDDGEPVPKWYMERLFKKACINAEVGPYRLHDCRHTFNTNMVKAGVNKSVIMKLTGHKTLAMFLRYSHLDQEQSESAMESLGELLSAKRGKANG
jgi:integrase